MTVQQLYLAMRLIESDDGSRKEENHHFFHKLHPKQCKLVPNARISRRAINVKDESRAFASPVE